MTAVDEQAHAETAQREATPAAPHVTGAQWRHVHRVTPVVRSWQVIAGLLFVVATTLVEVSSNLDEADELTGLVEQATNPLWIALGLAVALALLLGWSWLAWRKTTFAVNDFEVVLRQGVVFRQTRHARLDRLQAVDIRQPVVARIFGLAELRFEVAGGTDSKVALGFLRDADAHALRTEVLARAAGVYRPTSVAGAPTGAVTPGAPTGASPAAPLAAPASDGAAVLAQEAPEQEMYVVPPSRLAVSLLRSPGVWFGVVPILVVMVVSIAIGDLQIALGSAPVLIGVGPWLWGRFVNEFGFRAALSPDGIRVRRGLLETRAQTIPPGRVQAVQLIQGPFWRGNDWWRVKINVAGFGQAENEVSQSVLLPVGTRAEALTALWMVLPDLGTEAPLELLDEGLTGIVPRDGSAATRPDGSPAAFTNAPRRARWVDPISWRRDAFAVTDRALLLRHGRIVRRLDVVPHERTQSLCVSQGPLQRRLRVASFTVHTTPGPVVPQAPHLDMDDAHRLLEEQAARALAARQAAGPEKWMEQVAQAVPAAAPALAGLRTGSTTADPSA